MKIKIIAAAWLLAGLWTVQQGGALTLTSVTSGNGLPALSVQWTDSAGQPRTAIMVKQDAEGPGYLYQLTYQVDGSPRVCAGTGITGYPGDGFVENHNSEGSDNNSLDDSTPGTTTVLLAGPSHAIIAYNMPTYQILGETIPTTIYWFFADGRSHPIFALSQDARATAGNLGADTRSPYGSLNFDGGDGSSDVGGASYGDTLKFVTLAAPPELVTGLSGWRDTQANTIPYAMEWVSTNEADAEMGHVATLPITLQDQGTDRNANTTLDPRNQQALNGPMIPYGASDTGPDAWAFQLLDYILHPDYDGDTQGPGASVQVSYSKLAWGGNFGRVGGYNNGNTALNGTQYSEHYDSGSDILTGTRASGLLMAYSVFVVLGTHAGSYTNGAVGQEVTQMENAALATLSASTGTVETSGAAGVGGASTASVTYTPAGYDPIYATWDIAAIANAVNATLTPAANHPLDHPVFVIQGYTAEQLPASISVGSGLTTNGANFFASVDTNGQRLWITVNRVISNSVNLVVNNAVLPAPANEPIYTNNGILLNGFQDYSWATNVNYSNTSPVYSGSYSISVTAAANTALSLYHADFSTAPYATLSFWINGGAAGAQGLQVLGVTNQGVNQYYAGYTNLPALAANTWTQLNIPLAALGVANVTNCQGFWFWPTLSGATTFYVDSIQLNLSAAPSLSAAATALKSGSFVLQLSGVAGQTYWIQTSTDLVTWSNVSTNVLASSSVNITNTVIAHASRQYWRAVLP